MILNAVLLTNVSLKVILDFLYIHGEAQATWLDAL
jgi:hypothetical protein